MRSLRTHMFAVLMLGSGLVWAGFGQVVLSRFEARTQGNDIVVEWETRVEQEVKTYVLERKTQYDVAFREIKRFTPHGPQKKYRYRDTHVYKNTAEQVYYRLRILYKDGTIQLIDPIATDYTSTAVRRTWGSIKAMFQE